MTSQQAQDYIRRYQQILADDTKRGSRRSPSLLPASKEEIMCAIKLEIAQLYYINSATEELVQPLIRDAMFIDSFTNEALDTLAFVEAMQRRRQELQDFHNELMTVKRDNSFYWQRIYSMVGVSLETRSQTFFDQVKTRIGLGRKPAADREQTTLFDRSQERFSLD